MKTLDSYQFDADMERGGLLRKFIQKVVTYVETFGPYQLNESMGVFENPDNWAMPMRFDCTDPVVMASSNHIRISVYLDQGQYSLSLGERKADESHAKLVELAKRFLEHHGSDIDIEKRLLTSTKDYFVTDLPFPVPDPVAHRALKQAQYAEKIEQAQELDMVFDMPDLTGTPKQVDWAITIRATAVKAASEQQHAKIIAGNKWSAASKKAKFWIDGRPSSPKLPDDIRFKTKEAHAYLLDKALLK